MLWSDEAETALIAKNTLTKGVPVGFYKVPFYENAYLVKSDSEIYDFKPTNYLRTDLVSVKGWLTYYVLAVFSFFGKSEFLLRFPFALLGVFSMMLVFLIANKLFNKRVALMAVFLQAFNPHLLYYERQVRYYSIALFLMLLAFYIFLRNLDNKKSSCGFSPGLTAALILLFHTQMVFCFVTLFIMSVYLLFIKKNFKFVISKDSLKFITAFLIFTLPWMILVKFSFLFTKQPSQHNLFQIMQTALANIADQGSIVILVLFGLLLVLIKSFKSEKNYFFILLWSLAFLIIPPFVSPLSSFEEKMFLPLIPVFFILVAVLVDWSTNLLGKKKIFAKTVLVVFLFLSVYHIDTLADNNLIERPTAKDILQGNLDYGANWVAGVVDYLDEENAGNTLILSTNSHFSFLFNSHYLVQTVWPVKKSYLDSAADFYLIERTSADGTCEFFYQYLPVARCVELKNYNERVHKCEKILFDAETTIYKC